MSPLSVKDEIRRFIQDNYLAGPDRTIGDDDSFLEKGLIDSIGVIELTAFVQQTYGIKVEVKEIVPDNFDTLNRLERYIRLKKTS